MLRVATLSRALVTAALLLGATAASAAAQVTVGGQPMLPGRTIVDNAANSADHTTLVAAVAAAGLVDTLKSDGPFGTFDMQQVQRGYQVYKEVCKACHSLNHVAFRDLAELGYTEAEVKAEAASWTVPGIDPNTGEETTRPGTPTDYFPKPFANDVAARAANHNAVPPDLSLMAKAREGGPAYIYSLLTGFTNPATYKNEHGKSLKQEFPDFATPQGLYFNPYFANLNLAMPPPLANISASSE